MPIWPANQKETTDPARTLCRITPPCRDEEVQVRAQGLMLAGWAKQAAVMTAGSCYRYFEVQGDSVANFAARVPNSTLHSIRSVMNPKHMHSESHPSRSRPASAAFRQSVLTILALSSLAARLPDHPPHCELASGAGSLTNQRPDGLVI